MILSAYSPFPTTIDITSALPAYAYKASGAQVLRTHLLEELATMKIRVPATLRERQRRYRRHFDTRVRSIPNFQREQLLYVDRPPLATADNEPQKSQAYNTLISKTRGPYLVMDVLSHTLTNDESGISITI